MKIVNQETKDFSIKSLESTYNKLSNAYKSMTEKGSNTTLVFGFLKIAFRLGNIRRCSGWMQFVRQSL